MDVRKRQQNEKTFEDWHELSSGGRRYWYYVEGRSQWMARYVKEVDAGETTIRFYQEIYDAYGNLREVHHNYLVDLGHRKMKGDKQ